jgi:hypothetical protein
MNRSHTGARAWVLAAILFSPEAASADPPPPDPDADASAADCEAAAACHAHPISRAGCFDQDRRCRVFRERHPEARDRGATPPE